MTESRRVFLKKTALSTAGETLAAPVDDGYKSNLLPHLGNISQHYGRTLDINHLNGHMVGDSEAASMWTRDYEYG